MPKVSIPSVVVVALALPLVGCPLPVSELEQLHLVNHGVYVGALYQSYAWTGDQPVLVGTRMCPEVRCHASCPEVFDPSGALVADPEVGACFSRVVSGPASEPMPGCLQFDAEGAVSWRFMAADCPLRTDQGYTTEPDQFLFVATTAQGVYATFDFLLERVGPAEIAAEEPTYELLSPAEVPADFTPDLEKPVKLLAGEPVRLPVALFEENGVQVGFSLADAEVVVMESVPATGGGPAAEVEVGAPFPTVTLAAGGEVDLYLEVAGESFWAGHVVGVPAAELTSIDLVAFRQIDAASDNVVGYRAIVRDGDDEAVLGVPVDWEVIEGRYAVGSLLPQSGRSPEAEVPEGEPAGDWMYLEDVCRPRDQRAGPRTAGVTATYGALSTSLTLSFVSENVATADPVWVEDARCQGPDVWTDPEPEPEPDGEPDPGPEGDGDVGECACDSASAEGSAPGLFVAMGLFALGVQRRRTRIGA